MLLGEAWKSLPQEDREGYSQRAKVMADEQKKLYPDCWKRKRTAAVQHHNTPTSGATPTSPAALSPSSPSAASLAMRMGGMHPLPLPPGLMPQPAMSPSA